VTVPNFPNFRHGILIAMVAFVCCSNIDNSGNYVLRVGDMEIDRTNDLILISTQMDTKLSQYQYKGRKVGPSSKYYKDEYMQSSYLLLVDPPNNHKISIDINVYRNAKDTDKWFDNFNKVCGARLLDGYKDAILVPMPKCGMYASYRILYANAMVDVAVYPYGQNGAPPDQRDEYIKNRDNIFREFLQDFYPYFMQCAEQAKVPIQETSR